MPFNPRQSVSQSPSSYVISDAGMPPVASFGISVSIPESVTRLPPIPSGPVLPLESFSYETRRRLIDAEIKEGKRCAVHTFILLKQDQKCTLCLANACRTPSTPSSEDEEYDESRTLYEECFQCGEEACYDHNEEMYCEECYNSQLLSSSSEVSSDDDREEMRAFHEENEQMDEEREEAQRDARFEEREALAEEIRAISNRLYYLN